MCTGGGVDSVEGRVIVALLLGATKRWSDYAELSQGANRLVAHFGERLDHGRSGSAGPVPTDNREVPPAGDGGGSFSPPVGCDFPIPADPEGARRRWAGLSGIDTRAAVFQADCVLRHQYLHPVHRLQ